jgi:hypothetical protein
LDVSNPEEALLQAAVTNDASMVKVLAVMDRKALKKHVDYALLYAVRAGSSDVVKAMFQYGGASLNAKDAFGNSVWDFAQQSPEPEIMNAVLQQVKNPGPSEEIRANFTAHTASSKPPPYPKSKAEQGQTSNQRGASVVRRGSKSSISKLHKRSTL